jgi:hypothetical protein
MTEQRQHAGGGGVLQILVRRDPETGDVCALTDRRDERAVVYRRGEFPLLMDVPQFDRARAAVAWMQANPGGVCLVDARLGDVWDVRLGRTREDN